MKNLLWEKGVKRGILASHWLTGEYTSSSNSIALTSTDNKGITLNPLYGVFAAVHRVTLPRGLLCKSLHARWRCSNVRDGVDMVMDMRIRGNCYADEAREATSLGSVKDVWSLLLVLG